jgi:hypothetical protein
MIGQGPSKGAHFKSRWNQAFVVLFLFGLPVAAQAATNADALRKVAQNPIASLISVPVQDNFNFNISPGDRTQGVLNIQPVIPARISDSWNLITRVITPIVYQPIPTAPGQVTPQGVHGLGDINPTFFLSPAKPSKVIWGVGRPSSCRQPPAFAWVRESGVWALRSLPSLSRGTGLLGRWSTMSGRMPDMRIDRMLIRCCSNISSITT